jgi:hypothetical protein
MRNIKTLAIAATLALSIAPAALAQSSDTATADANATIIAAISLTNTVALDFGDIVQDASGGTVTVSSAGVLSTSGPVSLGGELAASYSVTGDASKSFAVTPPAGSITITEAGSDTMTVGTFTSSCLTGCTLPLGAGGFSVGATLTVGANQTPGAYTGTFDVTVAYE